jgi:hypothetical protein
LISFSVLPEYVSDRAKKVQPVYTDRTFLRDMLLKLPGQNTAALICMKQFLRHSAAEDR